jgi:hypothetical protein
MIGSVYVQRFRADGTVEPGWPANGRLLALGRAKFIAMPDGTGGYYVASSSITTSSEDLVHYLQRITVDGTSVTGWPTDGMVICDAPGVRDPIRMAPDGEGGALLCWADSRPSPTNEREIYVHRILNSGQPALGWTVNGVRVSNDQGVELYESSPDVCADGFGGTYVTWERAFDFESPAYVQHLAADGQVAPDWPTFGVRVAVTLGQFSPRVASDGAHGAIVAWDESQVGGRTGIFANRFGLTGPVSTTIALVSSQANSNVVELRWHAIDSDRLNAWVERSEDAVTWIEIGRTESEGRDVLSFEDRSVFLGTRYGYRLGYFEGGARQVTEATWLEVPGELALALDGFRPNPAREFPLVSFTLPDAEPATLELFDVRGRVLGRRAIGELGAGDHTVRMDVSDQLPPGMYWIRLTQGTRQLVRRGVVID